MNLLSRSAFALITASFLLPISAVEAKPPKDKGKGKSSQNQNKGQKGQKGKGKPAKGNKGNKGKGPQKGTPPSKGKPDRWDGKKEKFEKLRFVENDRTHIVNFFEQYRANEKGLPPGLAKNLKRGKGLPPGWQKKLEPGFLLEEPWLTNFIPVSYDLFPNLTRPDDTRLYLYDDRLVRVYEPERRILDVLVLEGVRAILR